MSVRSKKSPVNVRRTMVPSLVIASVLAVAACGADSSSSGTDASTVATATTTTAAPQSTLETATTIVTTTAPATTTTEATTPETEPATTAAPTTAAPTTDVTTPDTTPSGEYVSVPGPSVAGQTAPVDASNNHPDGVYYASVSEGGDPPPATGNVVFELVQLFTGQACIDHFGDEDEDACVGDYGVETDPTSSVEVDLDGVFISVADAASKQSYQISGAELNELLIGGDPASGAPADYLYSGFGYMVTYQGGVITRLEQWWTP